MVRVSGSTLQRDSSDSVSWLMIAALVASIGLAELQAPLAIDIRSFTGLAIACAALTAVAAFYRRVRINENFAVSCIGLQQALLFTGAGSILSYLLARNGGAFWDSTLYGWDQALGLDWLGYVRFVDAHPWLVLPYRLAYGSLIPQIIIVILALGFGGRLDQLRIFILAAILSGITAVLLSPLFPAVSNYVHLGLTQADFDHVSPWAGYVHLKDLTALRGGQVMVLSLPKMQGIITFPSYHACLAALTLWAFWNSRLGWLRWAGAGLSLMTLAATPVDGGHYFVDVFAGLAIAVACIAAASRLVYVRIGLPELRALPFRRSRAASVQ
jgi:PAP2 superfamily protein